MPTYNGSLFGPNGEQVTVRFEFNTPDENVKEVGGLIECPEGAIELKANFNPMGTTESTHTGGGIVEFSALSGGGIQMKILDEEKYAQRMAAFEKRMKDMGIPSNEEVRASIRKSLEGSRKAMERVKDAYSQLDDKPAP